MDETFDQNLMKSFAGDRESRERFSSELRKLPREEQDRALWRALTALQGCEFQTMKGLTFTYVIRGGEFFVDRKVKSITQSSVLMAFHRAMELDGIVSGPKKLGTFGASYLYPVFVYLGIIHREQLRIDDWER